MKSYMERASDGEKSLVNAVFTSETLESIDFIDADLRWAQFDGAKLQNVRFVRCELIGSNFNNALMVGCTIDSSTFAGANFRGLVMHKCSLQIEDFYAAFVDEKTYTDNDFVGYRYFGGMLIPDELYDHELMAKAAPAAENGNERGTTRLVRLRSDLRDSAVEVAAVARNLSDLARIEIAELEGSRPNSDDQIRKNTSQIEYLSVLINGLERVSENVDKFEKGSVTEEEVATIIDDVSRVVAKKWKTVEIWWGEDSARGFITRSSMAIASLAFFGWIGAPLAVATPVILASTHGKELLDKILQKKSEPPPDPV